MGKGDKKTKKGKIIAGSYGVSRPSKFANRSKNETSTQVTDTKTKSNE